ncbi:MAG: hypothetical protein RLZZ148_2795, partial [Cyanobacteriota bacterium]
MSFQPERPYLELTSPDNEVFLIYCELITAVWEGEDSFGKKNSDITHLVWQIRKKIESDPSEPRYLKNVMSDGYILEVP